MWLLKIPTIRIKDAVLGYSAKPRQTRCLQATETEKQATREAGSLGINVRSCVTSVIKAHHVTSE